MAAGKFGEVVLSRKQYHGYGTKEVGRGHGDDYGRREYREKRDKVGRDWYRMRESHGRKKEEMYDNDNWRSRREEREPGEISSGSASDGSVASGLSDDRDVDVGLPPRKKQKVWEKEEKNIGKSSLLLEDEFVPTGKTSVSRWADIDEYECNEDKSSKGKPTSGSSLTSLGSGSKKSSPEDGEFSSENARGSECRIEDAELNEDDVHDNNMCYGSDTDSEEQNDYRETPEPMSPEQREMVHSSRSVHDFERLNKIGAGTYGVVYQCRDKMNGEIVALKKVKMDRETEGFPMSSLREINILTSLRHPSIVEVKEVVVEEEAKYERGGTYLVMEYMEHDLKDLMESMKQPFSQSEVKCLMLQLLEGVKYLHDNWVLHRDLKTSNLLLNNRGELKICDFGLSRQYGSPLKPYTPLVVTLWYRAPELLLGAKQYSTAIDMWSLGCIMAELLAKKPLFSGESEIDQLNKIFKTLGTPTETNWPGFCKLPGSKLNFVKQKYNLLREKFPPTSFIGSPYLSAAGFDLLEKLLTFDPEKRITAADAVNHAWFHEVPLPKAKEFMPTFPAQHDKTRHCNDGEKFSLVIYCSCKDGSLLVLILQCAPFICFLRCLKAMRDFKSILHPDSVNGMLY